MLESTIRPLNELLRRLGLLDAATVEPEVRLLAGRRLLRPLLQVCALVAFDRPVANMRLPQKPQEPKYLRWILTSIVSLMELFNRSEGAWHDWLEAADGASADAAAAACASWSPVLGGLEVWPSLPAARTDLVDEAAEMLQFLSGIFDQYGRRWGAWNGLLLLDYHGDHAPAGRAALPLESLPSLAGAALSSLFSFIQQPQALASMGERRRHPRLAALPPDLRQPALETARFNLGAAVAPTRADLAPSLVPRLLRCAAAARPNQLELLSEAVGMLADLLQSSARNEGFSARFRRQLAQALDEATGAPGSQLVSAVSEQLSLLRESARRPSGSAGSAAELADDPQALALHRLQRRRGCINWPGAAACASAAAPAAGGSSDRGRLLPGVRVRGAWIGAMRRHPGATASNLPVELRDCTTQAQLKERLLQTASERFRAGGLPLKAKQLTEELWLHLKDRSSEERAVLLRLSGLCQELQSPNLSDWRCPAPAYYLAALRSGAEAELPAEQPAPQTRRVTSSAPSRTVRPIEEAAARLERLLHGAIVLPAALAGAEDAFSEDLDESDGEDEEIFEDPDAADTQSCDSPALRIRLYPLTPVPEPPMPGLVGGGSGFGGFSALSAMRHHRYNDVRRFQRFDAPRRRRQRHRLLRLYETEEPLPAPVRLLPARLLETRRQGPLEVATASAEATVWQLRCAARQNRRSRASRPGGGRRGLAPVDAAASLSSEPPSSSMMPTRPLTAETPGRAAPAIEVAFWAKRDSFFEQATRCLELLYHRRPPGIGTGGSNEEVVDISRASCSSGCAASGTSEMSLWRALRPPPPAATAWNCW
uniref:Non-specific serine/threonine protein kinase n=1 Tax=Macrostomum lignano TaxID=282301 RepID=A0A1I8JS01_9PLAT